MRIVLKQIIYCYLNLNIIIVITSYIYIALCIKKNQYRKFTTYLLSPLLFPQISLGYPCKAQWSLTLIQCGKK